MNVLNWIKIIKLGESSERGKFPNEISTQVREFAVSQCNGVKDN